MTFERGLHLLGAVLDPQDPIERHEVFITTWWSLPGPMEKDLQFFVHITREGYQTPMDHYPGDWMYPADRWHAGETLEDRVLFQLPVGMPLGTYSVYIGAYRHSTGARLHVLSGPNDGDDRVLLGTITVRPLLPMVHQLIPPTRPNKMRAHPERIVN